MNLAGYTDIVHCTSTYLLGGQIQWENDKDLQSHSSSNWLPWLSDTGC